MDFCQCGHTRETHQFGVYQCYGIAKPGDSSGVLYEYCLCRKYAAIELMVKPRDFQSRDGGSIPPGGIIIRSKVEAYNNQLWAFPNGEIPIQIFPWIAFYKNSRIIIYEQSINGVRHSCDIEVKFFMQVCQLCHVRNSPSCGDYHYSEPIRCTLCGVTTQGFNCLWWIQGLAPIVMKESFCFTGRLVFQRKYAADIVKQNGGEVHKTLTPYTTFLVVGDKPGTKLARAQRMNIQVLTQQEFLSKMGGQPLASKKVPVQVFADVLQKMPDSGMLPTRRKITL